jgi:uncharacterized surface protein with fasciclin (FAS1) repeats
MWNNKYLNTGRSYIYLATLLFILVSCGKDEYYVEGGTSNPVYSGNMLQFLESKPGPFDSVVAVIKLAKLEKVFAEENVTFFAPTDEALNEAIEQTNSLLYLTGKDTVETLSDISPELWKKYLLRYVFKGSNKLKDYYQIDFELVNVFPGQSYYSYNNTLFNIGVVYNDVSYKDEFSKETKGIKYAGYRQIVLSFIRDLDDPQNSSRWARTFIASSDNQTSNGVVHVINNLHTFGFGNFYSDVYSSK